MTTTSHDIRIIAAPIGDAPLWVREAWIGLALPLALPAPVMVECGSVLSPLYKTWSFARIFIRARGRTQKIEGYIVWSAAAIERLNIKDPRAAEWWREKAPLFLDPRQTFVFNEDACERIPGS